MPGKVDIPLHSPGTSAPGTCQDQHEQENDRNVSSAFDKMQHDDVRESLYENVLVKGNIVNIGSNTIKDNNSCNIQPKPSNINIREGSLTKENLLPSENLIVDRQFSITSPKDASTPCKLVNTLFMDLVPQLL